MSAERIEVLAIAHELLRAAAGHPITVSTVDGQEVVLRLPTVEEFRAVLERGQRWHAEHGLSAPPPPSDERIADLVAPLRLGGAW